MKKFNESEMKKEKVFSRGVQVAFVLGIIFAMYFATTQAPIIPIMEKGRVIGWRNIDMSALAGSADPGNGKSGFLKILIVKHHDSVNGYYNLANYTINSTCYGNTFDNNSHNMSNIPYSTAFDIIVEFRWNATHAKSTSNNTWMLQWVRLNISCPQLHIHNWATGTGFINMTKINITTTGPMTNRQFIWTHFIMNNNGSGYTISKGENVSHCYFQPSAYY